MKCVSLKLLDRKDLKKAWPKNEERTQAVVLAPRDSGSYSSYQRNVSSSEDDPPCLSITNILPPSDIQMYQPNVYKRWENRRPRLRSSKIKKNHPAFDKTVEIPPDIIVETIEKTRIAEIDNEDEIDSDIQKLFEKSFSETKDDDVEETRRWKSKRKRKKHKHKEESADETKCIFKAPSPETVQIIRVNVTTNCSVDKESDGDESEKSIKKGGKGGKKVTLTLPKADVEELQADGVKELYVESKKAMLFERVENY